MKFVLVLVLTSLAAGAHGEEAVGNGFKPNNGWLEGQRPLDLSLPSSSKAGRWKTGAQRSVIHPELPRIRFGIGMSQIGTVSWHSWGPAWQPLYGRSTMLFILYVPLDR